MVQRKSERSQSFFSLVWLQFTLPHCDTVPAHLSQLLLFLYIPFLIAFDLLFPKVCIRLRHPEVLATIMSMPKATVDEYACTVFAQHNIWMARQARIIQPISESLPPQIFAHKYLWLRVRGTNRSHIFVSLLLGKNIHKQE